MYAPFQTKLVWKPRPKGQHLSVWSFDMNTYPPPGEFFRRTCTSVSDFFVQIYRVKYHSFSNGHCNFFITWQTKKIKFLLKNKVKKEHSSQVVYKGACNCTLE